MSTTIINPIAMSDEDLGWGDDEDTDEGGDDF